MSKDNNVEILKSSNKTVFTNKMLMECNSLTKLGFAFTGINLIDECKKSEYEDEQGFPAFPFEFVGIKFESVNLEDKKGNKTEFESVLFLTPDQKIYHTSSEPVKNDMKNKVLVSEYVARNEDNLEIVQDGFIMMKEPILALAVWKVGEGEYGTGYLVLR